MIFLSRLCAVLSCLHIAACQTVGVRVQSYNIQGIDLQVIQASPEKIRQQCLFLNAEGEGRWRHQYLMFILNNNREVIEIADPLNMDKVSCMKHVSQIEKILRYESAVKLCVRGALKKKNSDDGSWKNSVDFGPLGTYKVEFESLKPDSICNSKKCYGDNSAYTYTCLGFTKQ